jgi:hypothetical protein
LNDLNKMNLALVSFIIAAVFMVIQYGTKANLDPKVLVKDGAAAFMSSLFALYGYEYYSAKPLAQKTTEVFTEKPTF